MGNIVAPQTGPAKLAGYKDEDLHANVVEALKVFSAASAAFAHAKTSIDGQYLKGLDALGGDSAKQAAAVRKVMK